MYIIDNYFNKTYVFNFTSRGKPTKCLLTKKKPRIRKFPKVEKKLSTSEYIDEYFRLNDRIKFKSYHYDL